jgi:hypothetical protein
VHEGIGVALVDDAEEKIDRDRREIGRNAAAGVDRERRARGESGRASRVDRRPSEAGAGVPSGGGESSGGGSEEEVGVSSGRSESSGGGSAEEAGGGRGALSADQAPRFEGRVPA